MASLSAQTLLCIALMCVHLFDYRCEWKRRRRSEGVRLLRFVSSMARHHLPPDSPLLLLQRLLPRMDCGQIIMMELGPPVVLALSLMSKRFQHCLMRLRSTGHPYIVANPRLASVEEGYFGLMSGKILNEAEYVPSNNERYPLGGIVSAIENSFQATPEVIYSKDAVEEICLCFYKDFKPRNCLASETSCPRYVSLPAYVSLGREESENDIAWISDEVL